MAMVSLLAKNVASLNTRFPSSCCNIPFLAPLFHFSTQTGQKDVPFIAQYLISSFEFPKDRALRVAADKNLTPIKTLERPESVVCLLKDIGLTDTQIRSIISIAPQLLSKSVSKTLEPCAHLLITGGFTDKTLIRLILHNPMLLAFNNPVPRLQFWRDFVGNNEETFWKLMKKWMLLTVDIDKKLVPRINFLKAYGCSDKEVQDIFEKYPSLVGISEDKIKSKMNFLVEKAGLEPKCIVKHPYLLTASLEKNLVPRYYVFSVLKSKGLLTNCSFFGVIPYSEINFVKSVIMKYEKTVTGLLEAYASIRAGKTLVSD